MAAGEGDHAGVVGGVVALLDFEGVVAGVGEAAGDGPGVGCSGGGAGD